MKMEIRKTETKPKQKNVKWNCAFKWKEIETDKTKGEINGNWYNRKT
jgi:hypothetical protein